MDTIRLMAETMAGKLVELAPCVELLLESKRQTPADRLTVVLALDPGNERYHTIVCAVNGVTRFSGLVDSQTRTVKEDGVRLTISARSAWGRMLDDEVRPGTYVKVRSGELVQKLAKPYGIVGAEFPKAAVLPELVVEKGSSVWSVLTQFCKQAYGRRVYINRDKKLTFQATGRVLHRVGSEELPYTALSITEDRYGLVSDLYVKNHEGQYRTHLKNKVAQAFRVKRTRYLHPGRAWERALTIAGKDALTERQLDYWEAEVLLPSAADLRVGDRAVLLEGKRGYEQLYVAEVRLQIAGGLSHTRVRLWDAQLL